MDGKARISMRVAKCTTRARYGIRIAAMISWSLSCFGQTTVQSVLNGASYSGNVAPGTWVAIFGTKLATTTTIAPSVPLPTQLAGVSVTVGGIPAPLNYVSPGQINAVIPFEVPIPTPLAGTVPVVVTTPSGPSSAFDIRLSRNAPGLFTQNGLGTGPVIAFDANFKPITVAGSGTIVLYADGLGPTDPPGSSSSGGAAAPPLNMIKDDLSVFIGDTKAAVSFAGLAPGFPGIYQLNVTPNGPISDRVYLQIGNWQSNVTGLPVLTGSNVANVKGSIDGLYPATGANAASFGGATLGPVGFSAMLMAAGFSTSFDILANAKPFSVVATGEAGKAVIIIDPAARTYTATISAPTTSSRSGDFSKAPFTVLDFYGCSAAGVCLPFPVNVVPQSRLDPIAQHALALQLPTPTSASTDGVNATYVASGALPAGDHFGIDSTSLSNLMNFGGFIQIARPGASPRPTTFSLYVDGALVASTTAMYAVN